MKLIAGALLLGAALTVGGCGNQRTKAPDVADSIHTSLDAAGFKDVSVKQDRDKGVVTLKGTVPSDAEKMRAESIARAQAGSEVVANEIAVVPEQRERRENGEQRYRQRYRQESRRRPGAESAEQGRKIFSQQWCRHTKGQRGFASRPIIGRKRCGTRSERVAGRERVGSSPQQGNFIAVITTS